MNSLNVLVLLAVMTTAVLSGQDIPDNRVTDWTQSGCRSVMTPTQWLNLADFGGDPSGLSPSDDAMDALLAEVNSPAEIFLPHGSYRFDRPLILPDSVLIRGEAANDGITSLTQLRLNPGINGHGIVLMGLEVPLEAVVTEMPIPGSNELVVDNPLLFSSGDILLIYAMDDGPLVNNDWALHSTGQIAEVLEVEGDTLRLNHVMRRNYSKESLPELHRIIPRRQVHIQCVSIERLDETSEQMSNVYMDYALDCSFSGLGSLECNYAHVDVRHSSHITISNSSFREAHSFGSGGKGYGIMTGFASGDCLIQENVFERLRHSIIMQAGANGNVVAYNYSFSPFWTDVSLPSNSAGDIVLHGNYPYLNLFEGNVVQNIVIDDSHGINGPYNTFFRNRAELYGIFMNNSPASDNQNFIGNQVSNSGFLLGLYILEGDGHFTFGNQVRGTIRPAGTGEPSQVSLMDYSFGSFYSIFGTVPPIRTNNWQSGDPHTEAEYRRVESGHSAVCTEIIYETPSITERLAEIASWKVYPNPARSEFMVKRPGGSEPSQMRIFSSTGLLVNTIDVNQPVQRIACDGLASGLYLLEFSGNHRSRVRLVIE